jgi:acyl carrier protein
MGRLSPADPTTLISIIKQFLKEKLLVFTDDGQELKDEDSFLEQGIIDSTGVLELVGFLEEKFGITIEDDELVPDNLDSLAKAAVFVTRKMQDASE